MSVERISIEVFVTVIESASNLLTLEDWSELEQLNHDLPENDQKIIVILEDWLKLESRRQILQDYEQQLTPRLGAINIEPLQKGIGNTKSPTPSNQPNESSKELIDNTIKKNSPLSNSPKSNQKP